MDDLKELLGDIADQAKAYDVGEKAWAAARRRRYLVRAAPVVVAVAVTVPFAVTGLPSLPKDQPKPRMSATSIPTWPSDREVEQDGDLPWLPRTVAYPKPPPRLLPRDRAVGRGSVVVGGEQRGAETQVLITESGQKYRISSACHAPKTRLSPGGRWLTSCRQPDVLALRDLTGTTEYTFRGEGWFVAAWSSDERYAVLGNAAPGDPVRVDLRTGEQRPLRGYSPREWVDGGVGGVLPGGEVLLVRADAEQPAPTGPGVVSGHYIERLTWHAVDPVSNRRRTGAIDLHGAVTTGDQLISRMALAPDGATLVLTVRWGEHEDTALLTVDLATGRPLARYELKTVGETTELFVLAAYRSEGILLYRYSMGPIEVQVLDPTTGQRTVVSRLPREGGRVRGG